MIGQSQVTDPLMTALRGDRIGHAYLFSGPRGCGKTTSARILARCLNCAQGPTDTPCGVCESCVELSRAGGGSLDVIEIDAASHNGVDDARALRERAVFAPARDRYKIFILDEAHMVTSQGFNALLKLVEEPPEHVKFIFATTEPEKVIGTIRSRTHHYPFRLVPPAPMLEYVESLCAQEGIAVEPGVLPLVVRAGGGSPRDTLSILDQMIAGSEAGGVGYERAVALLGYTHGELLDGVVEAFASGDAGAAFSAVDRVIQTGQDPRRFVDDLLERIRDLIIIAATGAGAAAVLRGTPADELERMAAQARDFGAERLSRSADIVSAALDEMGGATSPRLQLELMIARVLTALSASTEPAGAPSEPAPGGGAGGAAAPSTAASASPAAPAAAPVAAAAPAGAAAPADVPATAAPTAAPVTAPPAAAPTGAPAAPAAAPTAPTGAPAAPTAPRGGSTAPADAPAAAPGAAPVRPAADPASPVTAPAAPTVTDASPAASEVGPIAASAAAPAGPADAPSAAPAAAPVLPAGERASSAGAAHAPGAGGQAQGARGGAPETGVDPTKDEVPAAGWATVPPGGASAGAPTDAAAESAQAPAAPAGAAQTAGAAGSGSAAPGTPAGAVSASGSGDAGAPGAESAGAPAPADAASGPLTLDALRGAWRGIVGALRSSAPQSAQVVAAGRPAEVQQGDVVMMSFPSEQVMGAFKGAPANDLRSAIADALGVQVKYRARVDPPQAPSDDVPPPDDDPEPGPYDDPYAPAGAPQRDRGPASSAQAPRAGRASAAASSRSAAPASGDADGRGGSNAPAAPNAGAAAPAAPVTEWSVAAIPNPGRAGDPAASGPGGEGDSPAGGPSGPGAALDPAAGAPSAPAESAGAGSASPAPAMPAAGGPAAVPAGAAATAGAPGAPAAQPAEAVPDDLPIAEPEPATDWGVNLNGPDDVEPVSGEKAPSLGDIPGLVSASSVTAPAGPRGGERGAAPGDGGEPEPNGDAGVPADAGDARVVSNAGSASESRIASNGSDSGIASDSGMTGAAGDAGHAKPTARAAAAAPPAPAAAPPAAPAAPAAAPGFAPASPEPEPEPAPRPEFTAPEEEIDPSRPTVQRRQVNVPDGVERRGEAVVRQLLGATFLHEEPYDPPTRFN
ncbi:DNA polymerase III subunit gamma and tau [Microbacterium halophytorum]|uniref:DNA polymerase III subunit gamma and tau n=1 Tax=Microbacterium halophytorum TaxID=2067568 RepID=UPI001E30D02E|nr:DNA polymerase III subunit gamma and tau [Microbacterium halophytorum]